MVQAQSTVYSVWLDRLDVYETSEFGYDEVYFKIIADGVSSITEIQDMNEDSGSDSTWNVNKTFDFISSLTIELWEDDGDSGDDLLGTAKFTPDSLPVPIEPSGFFGYHTFSGDSSIYFLYTVKTERTVAQNNVCSVAVIDFIDAIRASSTVNRELVGVLVNFAVEYYDAGGQVVASVGEAAGRPEVAAISEAISALKGPILAVPALAEAIGNARDSEDDLYISLAGEPDDDVAFWPIADDNYDIKSGTSTGILQGSNRVIPYVFGLVEGVEDKIDVNFWEYDSVGSDDQMGKFRIIPEESDSRQRVNLVIDESEGSIYGVAYRVIPITCPSGVVNAYRNARSLLDTIDKAEAYNEAFRQVSNDIFRQLKEVRIF